MSLRFDDALRKACEPFGVTMYAEQKSCVENLLAKRDVFACMPTGYGKSLIYHALPTVAKLMGHFSNPAVIVVSPLIALMREQVTSLREKGIAAAQIGHSDAENDTVISGQATVIYGSPEMLLDNDLWRRTVAGPSVKPRLAALVVDEVHTVAQWYIYIYFFFRFFLTLFLHSGE